MRFNKPENKIYMNLKLPNCKFDELEVSSTGLGRKFSGFKSEVFISIEKSETGIKIEKFYNEKIPKKFLTEWNQLKR